MCIRDSISFFYLFARIRKYTAYEYKIIYILSLHQSVCLSNIFLSLHKDYNLLDTTNLIYSLTSWYKTYSFGLTFETVINPFIMINFRLNKFFFIPLWIFVITWLNFFSSALPFGWEEVYTPEGTRYYMKYVFKLIQTLFLPLLVIFTKIKVNSYF